MVTLFLGPKAIPHIAVQSIGFAQEIFGHAKVFGSIGKGVAAAQAGGKFGVGDVLEHGGFVGPVFGLRFELVGRIRQIERAAGKVPVLVDQGGAHLGGRIKPRGVDAHNAPVLQRKARWLRSGIPPR